MTIVFGVAYLMKRVHAISVQTTAAIRTRAAVLDENDIQLEREIELARLEFSH